MTTAETTDVDRSAMSDTPEGSVDLPKRVPQGSEGAQLDRRIGWSGRIIPLPEFCTDVELMAWVHERLHYL